MPLPIEHYALIGDGCTAALVGADGSIDWMCVPRFDSPACFAALLGQTDHGRWLVAPTGAVRAVRRRYREGTQILETEFDTDEGTVRVIDTMPLSATRRDIVRIVEGVRGRVRMRMELVVRFDYGTVVPWGRHTHAVMVATAGPDTLELHTGVHTHGEHFRTVAEFEVGPDERVPFVLNYRASHHSSLPTLDAEQALQATEREWLAWSARSSYDGR